MKLKKYSYIVIMILMFSIGVCKTSADTSNYKESTILTNVMSIETKEKTIKSLDSIIQFAVGENTIGCEDLFGDPDNEESLAYLINEILEYPRIIVPILVILLGTIDMATAVISPKEDGMKKATEKFVKRVIIAVVVFFIPTLVNILMWLADIVWEGTGYSSCGI